MTHYLKYVFVITTLAVANTAYAQAKTQEHYQELEVGVGVKSLIYIFTHYGRADMLPKVEITLPVMVLHQLLLRLTIKTLR